VRNRAKNGRADKTAVLKSDKRREKLKSCVGRKGMPDVNKKGRCGKKERDRAKYGGGTRQKGKTVKKW